MGTKDWTQDRSTKKVVTYFWQEDKSSTTFLERIGEGDPSARLVGTSWANYSLVGRFIAESENRNYQNTSPQPMQLSLIHI